VERLLVGEVAVEDLEQAHHGARVHGLERQQAAATEGAMRLAQECLEGGGREVLGDLGANTPPREASGCA